MLLYHIILHSRTLPRCGAARQRRGTGELPAGHLYAHMYIYIYRYVYVDMYLPIHIIYGIT